MQPKFLILSLSAALLLAACSAPQENGEVPAAVSSQTESISQEKAVFPDAQVYTPENNMEPDRVSAGTMGDILCDQTLPDGTQVVCYWEPGSEFTKYWAIRQGDNTLLRFCQEDSAYDSGYAVESFSQVLGQDGFRILAPRGAAYFAYDYYVLDEEGVPRLIADCANTVEEIDLNQDGETDLRWYYHGNRETTVYFRRDGQLYQSRTDRAL